MWMWLFSSIKMLIKLFRRRFNCVVINSGRKLLFFIWFCAKLFLLNILRLVLNETFLSPLETTWKISLGKEILFIYSALWNFVGSSINAVIPLYSAQRGCQKREQLDCIDPPYSGVYAGAQGWFSPSPLSFPQWLNPSSRFSPPQEM